MVSAKQIKILCELSGGSVWQRNYYESVIRNEDSLRQIRPYITNNPAQWEFDRENPAASLSHRSADS